MELMTAPLALSLRYDSKTRLLCYQIQTRQSRWHQNALLRVRDWANRDGLRLAQAFVRQLYLAAPLIRDNESGAWFGEIFTGKHYLSYL